MHLFDVEIQNRVVKGKFKPKRIRGKQGDWHFETLPCIAESEEEAKRIAIEVVSNRRIIGVPSNTKRKLYRLVVIINVRRLA